MIYTMTDEIAYKLGKFDFPSFYQIAMWKVNKEPFELAHFFDWRIPGGMGGWACKQEGETYVTDWENVQAGGYLKLEEIKEISHKLAYIRGRLDSYSVKIEKDKISVHYANSHNFRDFLAQCFEDVIQDKFMLLPKKDGAWGREFNQNCPKYKVMKNERIGTIPCTPSVTLEADKEIINYITGKEII